MSRPLAALPLLALVLSLAACGGGDDAAADERQAYVSAAVEVCERARTEADALTTPATVEGFAPFVEESVALAEEAQTELSALTPPAADRAELESKVLDPFGSLVERGRDYLAQVKAAGSDQAALLPLLSQRPTAEGVDLDYLREYGLGVCADVLDR